MGYQEGERAPKTRRGGRLGIDHPVTTKALAALSLADDELAYLRPISNRLARDADAWMRRGGLAQERRLTRRDAEHIWRNQLAAYRPDGAR